MFVNTFVHVDAHFMVCATFTTPYGNSKQIQEIYINAGILTASMATIELQDKTDYYCNRATALYV